MTSSHPLPALLGRHQPHDLIAIGAASRTGSQLAADVRSIAERLAAPPRTQRGSAAEVILVCHDRYLFTAALLAAWERGYVVALPPNAQQKTIASLRTSGAVTTVLHDVDGMAGIDVRPLVSEASTATESLYVPPLLSPERRIVVVYTSGTTGTPMACPKTAGQLIGEARLLARTFGIAKGERVLATVPPHHIYGLLFGVLVPLVSGASFCRETVLHAEPLAELIARNEVRVLVSVPAHLRALSILDKGRIAKLPRVFSSGAPLLVETARDLKERFEWTITEVLGSSETGGIAWRERPEAPWTPFQGVNITEGAGGRMLVDSPFVDPSAPRPWVSGDRISLLPNRDFRHLGRVDGVLKIGSTRVSLAELEARLLAIPGVTDAAAIAVEVGGARGFECRALVAGAGLTPPSIRAALLPWLDPVVIPRRIRIVEALPRDPTGKLRREVLHSFLGVPEK